MQTQEKLTEVTTKEEKKPEDENMNGNPHPSTPDNKVAKKPDTNVKSGTTTTLSPMSPSSSSVQNGLASTSANVESKFIAQHPSIELGEVIEYDAMQKKYKIHYYRTRETKWEDADRVFEWKVPTLI